MIESGRNGGSAVPEDCFADDGDGYAHAEDKGQHCIDENRETEGRVGDHAGERQNQIVHNQVNENAVGGPGGHGEAQEPGESVGQDEKERGPDGGDGEVDGKAEQDGEQAQAEGHWSEKSAGNDLKEQVRRRTAQAVEDQSVGDVERSGDEDREAEGLEINMPRHRVTA